MLLPLLLLPWIGSELSPYTEIGRWYDFVSHRTVLKLQEAFSVAFLYGGGLRATLKTLRVHFNLPLYGCSVPHYPVWLV